MGMWIVHFNALVYTGVRARCASMLLFGEGAVPAHHMSLIAAVPAHNTPVCAHCQTRLIQRCTSVVEGFDSGFIPVTVFNGKPYHAPCVGATRDAPREAEGLRPPLGATPTTRTCLCGRHVELPCPTGPCVIWYDDRVASRLLVRVLHQECVGRLVHVANGGTVADRNVYDFALYASPEPIPGVSHVPVPERTMRHALHPACITAWSPGSSLPGAPPLPVNLVMPRRAMAKAAEIYAEAVRAYLQPKRELRHLLSLGMISVTRRGQAAPITEPHERFIERIQRSLAAQGIVCLAVHPGQSALEAWHIEAVVERQDALQVATGQHEHEAVFSWHPWFAQTDEYVATGVVFMGAGATLPSWRGRDPAAVPQPAAPPGVPG